MMIKLFRKMRKTMFDELEQARKDNGKYFHSAHEGFGVIYEEHDEAREESMFTGLCIQPLINAVKENNGGAMTAQLKNLERHALLAACEYTQVAAMARKMRESVQKEERAKKWKGKQSTTQAVSTPS